MHVPRRYARALVLTNLKAHFENHPTTLVQTLKKRNSRNLSPPPAPPSSSYFLNIRMARRPPPPEAGLTAPTCPCVMYALPVL